MKGFIRKLMRHRGRIFTVILFLMLAGLLLSTQIVRLVNADVPRFYFQSPLPTSTFTPTPKPPTPTNTPEPPTPTNTPVPPTPTDTPVPESDGGFVTGGGWLHSPIRACKLNPCTDSTIGQAYFGFVSLYEKGAIAPVGSTEFNFQAGDLNFHSSSYDWLIVNQNDKTVQYRGHGKINGQGGYKFMVWAQDGTPDTFRIRIWDEESENEVIVYDNLVRQPLGGGSIVVHKGS